jgi:hypothetical protein
VSFAIEKKIEKEKPGPLMSLNDPKWHYLPISALHSQLQSQQHSSSQLDPI